MPKSHQMKLWGLLDVMKKDLYHFHLSLLRKTRFIFEKKHKCSLRVRQVGVSAGVPCSVLHLGITAASLTLDRHSTPSYLASYYTTHSSS